MGLTKLAFLSIGRRKLRFGLLLLGIVVGVGFLICMLAGIDSATNAYTNSMLDTLGKTDLIVTNKAQNFDFNTVENLLTTSGVESRAMRFQRWWSGSISQTATSQTSVCVVGVQPQLDEGFGKYTVVSGSVKSISEGIDPTENVCVISEFLADALGVSVDNYIYIRCSGPSEFHRYAIGVSSNNFYLGKQIGDNFYGGLTGAPLSMDNGWHGVDIRGYENTLSIYIDNTICARYEDENFISSGGIAFETAENSEFLIDNVEICGVVGENVLQRSFFEDFESGTQNWDLEEGWHLETLDNNTVLNGHGQRWARLKDRSWSNYAFRTRFKIIQGNINFNYRVTVGQIQCGLRITAVVRDYGKVYDFDVDKPSECWQIKPAVFIHIDKAQEIFGTENITHVLINVATAHDTESVKNELQKALGGQFYICNIEQQVLKRAQESGAGGPVGMLAGIVLVMVGMLILNVMFINVTERKYEIGVLRCLGASRSQIFRLIILEGVFIGILGAAIAVGFAVVMLRLAGLDFTPYHILLGLTVGILFTTVASIAPAVFAGRVNLIETLRPSMRVPIKKRIKALGPIACAALLISGAFLIYISMRTPTAEGPGTAAPIGFILVAFGLIWGTGYFIKYLSWPFSRAFGKLGVLVERNIGRNLRRSVLTYGMIAFCVGLLVMLNTILLSMGNSAPLAAKYEVGADVTVQVRTPWEFENSIKSISGVADCAGIVSMWDSDISTGDNVLPNIKVRLLGVNSANYFSTIYEIRLAKILGGLSENDVFTKISSEQGYIILQDTLLTTIGLNLGDNVIWVTENFQDVPGSLCRVNFKIIATASLISGTGETVYPYWASKQGRFVAIVSADDVKFRDSEASFFYVSAKENADVKSLASEIQALCRANGYAIEEIKTELQQREMTESMFATINQGFSILILFMLLLAGLGVMVAVAYTVIERRREIGVIRACGIGARQSTFVFTGEAFVLALIGLFVGLIVGLPFAYLLINSVPFSPVVPLVFIFPWGAIGYAFVGCVLVASISAVYPAYKISKLKITDALRR